jgi:hypothetical protein
MFAVATDVTISCSQGRQYGPVLNLFFLDVYGGVGVGGITVNLPAVLLNGLEACLSWMA